MKCWNINVPDIIIYNGRIHTVDESDSMVEAVAISNNKITATGSNEEIKALAHKETQMIDAKGNSVIPGIIDSHNHMWEAGMLMEGIVTFGIGSITELKEAVRERTEKMEKGQWLQGGGWIESQFKEKRMPTRYDLDEVSPDNPVVLERIFSTCVANTCALKAAGITKDTPDPEGGEIGRDPNTKEPNGLLFRTAKQLIRDVMPTAFGENQFGTGKEIERVIQNSMKYYLSFGITGVTEPGVTPSIIRAYQNLREKNLLTMRVNLMPNWHGFAINENENFSDRLIDEYGLYTGFGDEMLRIGALKMAIDGGLTSRTALKSWPYLGEKEVKPVPLRMDTNKLKGWVEKAHNSGWSVGIHVMGDTAIELAVDAIYEAYLKNPVKRRHQIIHAYYPTTGSLIKMKEAGMIAALQPAFIYNEADGYDTLLPKDKQESFLPMRSYLDAGIKVASSTDMPSAHCNPFWGLYGAKTRKGIQGYQLGTKESISVTEMLRSMTADSAYLSGEENIKGTIEPGKLADIVILDKDLSNISDEELKDIKVSKTIFDGKIVYEI